MTVAIVAVDGTAGIGPTRAAAAVLAAAVAGRDAEESGVGGRADPEELAVGDAVVSHELDGPHDTAQRDGHMRVVVGLVVEQAAGDAVTELRVGAGVEDKGVPADVDELGRREAVARIVGGELEEAQGPLHDLLGEGPGDVLVLHDPPDEAVEQLGRDELAVRRHPNGRLGQG